MGIRKTVTRPRLTLAPAPAPVRVLARCEHAACDQQQSAVFWPYCSQTCGVLSFWDAVATIEQCVAQLDQPLRAFSQLHAILDTCPFDEASEKLQRIIADVRRAVSASQKGLAKSAVEFTHGTTAFTDALGPLIDGCDDDVRQANPAWMVHPETWSAAEDPKWQRGALDGGFVQHWLSYHQVREAGREILVVYRSTWLRDTDSVYRPVAKLLANGYQVLSREENPDPDMMFGHGELTIYTLDATNR